MGCSRGGGSYAHATRNAAQTTYINLIYRYPTSARPSYRQTGRTLTKHIAKSPTGLGQRTRKHSDPLRNRSGLVCFISVTNTQHIHGDLPTTRAAPLYLDNTSIAAARFRREMAEVRT